MGKVHACAGIPSFIGYIYLVILAIDSMCPNLLIDASDLWPTDSILTEIFQIVGYIWVGPSSNVEVTRVTMSFVILLVMIIALIALVVRSLIYQKYKRITNSEIIAVLIIYKFFLPLLIPHLLSGIPISYYTLIIKKSVGLNIIVAIFNPIMFFIFMTLLHLVLVPRVLLEDAPTHEWLPHLATASVGAAGLLSMVSTIPSFIDGRARMGASIFMLVLSLMCGFIVFRLTAMPRRSICVLIGTIGFTASFISLFQTLQIAVGVTRPEILLVAIVLGFLLIFFICRFFNTKIIMNAMMICDQCQDATDAETEHDIMEREFTNFFIFIGKIRAMIEHWHPYFITWKFFNFALAKWPDQFEILLLYGRLLSFFPNHNDKMIWVSSLLAKLEKCASRTSYLLQFRHIARTRQTTLSVALKKEIDQLKTKVDILMALIRRFWENILQKNVSSVWDDSAKINHHIEELDSTFCQLVDDYPNNPDVIDLYLEFAKKVHHSYDKIKGIEGQLELVKKFGRIRSDLPLAIAIQVYPNLQQYTQEMMERPRTDEEEEQQDKKVDEEQDDKRQLEFAIQDLTKHSKLGQVWIGFGFTLIMTCLSIGLFVNYHVSYQSKFLSKQEIALNFISYVSKLEYEINNLRLILTTYPIFHQANVPFDNIDNLMNIIAPNLYTKLHVLPKWIIKEETINYHVSLAKQQMSNMLKVLSQLDQSNEDVKAINRIVSEDIIVDNKNLKLILNQMVLDATSLASETVTTPYNFYNTPEFVRFSNYFYNQQDPIDKIPQISMNYAESDFESSFTSLNENMVLAVMMTLVLVTLPFMLQLFQLQIQADAITDSFTFFPNTEIRNIINTYGSSVSKFEDDITHVAQLSRGSSNKMIENIKLAITFAISFVPMTVCCLFLYYSAQSFISTSETNAKIIYQLVQPFGQLVDSMTGVVKIYDIDQDGPSYGAGAAALRATLLNHSNTTLGQAIFDMNEAIWGPYSSSNEYYQIGGSKVYLFTKELPIVGTELPSPRSTFEKVATFDIPQLTDLISMYMRSLFADTIAPIPPSDELFLNLLFYYSNFSRTERNEIYFAVIEEVCFDSIQSFKNNANINLIVAIVIQIFAAILLMLYMWDRHSTIRNALRFYYFISPEVITTNHNAMVLIESGKNSQDEVKSSFANADLILSKIGQGVALTDRDLIITDYNPAFLRILHISDSVNVVGKPLTELISRDSQDHSFSDFVQNLKEALVGKYPPDFSQNVTARLPSDKVVHFFVNTVCLTAHRAATEGDHAEIERIAMLFDDCTEIFMREQMLEQEQQQIKAMLAKVMPEPIINDLENGDDTISFVVQSVSIGQVRVGTPKKWDYSTNEPFNFFSSVFQEFDKIIKDYDLLCKARTFAHTYTYTGGLFSQMNKPDKHADQVVRFAIQLLKKVPELSKKLGVDIELTIGVHTGGPVIAGVMSLKRPNFQLIGPVMEYAAQMKATGVPGQVHITRAVYELIFSSGFKVTERGETKIRGGNTLTTYLVTP